MSNKRSVEEKKRSVEGAIKGLEVLEKKVIPIIEKMTDKDKEKMIVNAIKSKSPQE